MDTPIKSLYISKILGCKICSEDGKFTGKLVDIGVIAEDLKNPFVTIAKIKINNKFKYLEWKYFSLSQEKNHYKLKFSREIESLPSDKTIFLSKYILDKQIIDINGRKVVRVNDIKILENDGWFVAAVDIGTKGLLRRLGVSKILDNVLKTFNKEMSSELILWNDIEAILPSNDNIVLSKNYKKLSKLHTSDLADILEDFDAKTSFEIFTSLDNRRAADVLEEVEPDIKKKLLQTLPLERAADILEEMPSDEVVDILQDLNDEQAEKILNSMEKDASEEIRALLEFEEDTAGSIMSKEYITFQESQKVESVLKDFRERKINEEVIFYIYVVNHENKLTGVISLRNLLVSDIDISLSEIMITDYLYVYAENSIYELIKIFTKYNLAEIPVIDQNIHLIGCILINDIVDELVKAKQIKI